MPEMTRGRMPVCARRPRQELAAVPRLANGARRDRDDLVDLPRLGQLLEADQRLERRRHGCRGQRAAAEAAGAQPHHLLLAVHDLERQVGPHLDHDHVDGVGADVDGGQAHARAP